MPIIRVQAVIPRDTGLPEDVSINTWHFLAVGAGLPGWTTEIAAALQAFYTGVDQLLSPLIASPGELKFYDLGNPQPNPPYSVVPLTLVPGGASVPLPEEVAICLSFAGENVAGEVAARRRGRIYLGPLNSVTSAPVDGRVRVDAETRGTIVAAATALMTASDATANWTWGIYSPTQAAEGGDPDSWFTPVERGWVDDAYDTQRRRGPKTSARTSFT
jgi:hypothetical protein